MVQTKRGRDHPGLRQLSIFLQNRVGELADLLRHLESESVYLHGISITDSVDFAVVRMVVDDVDKARRIVNEIHLTCSENLVLGVQLPEYRDALLQICRVLIGAEINIHYIYPLLTCPHRQPGILFHVDDIETSVVALTQRGYDLIFEADLPPPPAAVEGF